MGVWYAVGIKIGRKADQVTVEAEDAPIAALKVKCARPEAAVTYVRKRNARGDRRHPHPSRIAKPSRGTRGCGKIQGTECWLRPLGGRSPCPS